MKPLARMTLTVAPAITLAACSIPATHNTPRLPARAAPTIDVPPPDVPATLHLQPRITQTWANLRRGFAMPDCPRPAVQRAQRETRYPEQFRKQLAGVMPMIDYVQRQAEQQGVAAEFALLPWVESHFRDVPAVGNKPAGMWQIVPITARGLGLGITPAYDGRLDRTASTKAALQLLSDYHDTWHDWRVADMAYNAGEYRIRPLIDHDSPLPESPAIPEIPVSHITRDHLTKLLAIACVVRNPDQFDVSLPTMTSASRLHAVKLPAPATLKQVADASGLSLPRVRGLNRGFRRGKVTHDTPMRVMLPRPAARSLRRHMADDDWPDSGHTASSPGSAPAHYTVTTGDSLWLIARRFDVGIEQLRRWNDIDGSTLQPGQTLRLQPQAMR